MALSVKVLGDAGRDNAALVTIDSGQRVDHLLFDCGEGCLRTLSVSDVQAIDHVFFSHFHMDHVSGFDTFFRMTYDRTTRPNMVWGPPNTATIMQHRFQGFMWNLHDQLTAQWFVNDIHAAQVTRTRFDAHEAFAQAHPVSQQPLKTVILDTPEYSVEAYTMNHLTPSMAYIVREKARQNVDTTRLAALGLPAGSWLKQVKDMQVSADTLIVLNERTYTVGELRQQLIVETAGQSMAYLTDFIMDAAAQATLIPALANCTVMLCESQYRAIDDDFAQRNYHMTCVQVAEVARQAQVEELILFHVSERYDAPDLRAMLDEARSSFPNTHFPPHWQV